MKKCRVIIKIALFDKFMIISNPMSKKMKFHIHIYTFSWIRNPKDAQIMGFGEISDPAPQTHPGILFFTNSKKYENTLGFLKIWGGLEQNGQNHAFLNSGDISYPFKTSLYTTSYKI